MNGVTGLLIRKTAAVVRSRLPPAASWWFWVIVVRREGQPVPPPTGAALAEDGEQRVQEGFRRGGRLLDVAGLLSCADELDAHLPDGAAGAAGIHKACVLGLAAAARATAPGASFRSVMGAIMCGALDFF